MKIELVAFNSLKSPICSVVAVEARVALAPVAEVEARVFPALVVKGRAMGRATAR